MDALLAVVAVIVVVLAFYFGLRAYTRRQVNRGNKSADID